MKGLSTFLLGLFVFAIPASATGSAPGNAQQNYQAYCVQCHGLKGNGMGVNIRDMSVQPRDHTDAKSMGGRSDEELFKVIKEGGLAVSKSVLMPAWQGTLSDAEITNLVGYLRQLCKCKFGK
ncbi:MAG: cytochrome c [Rhodospirillaceae bacterium]|jgi:cytochrome c oxidase cbb3-type subunit III|nr:cytochrome c [Rhodospirillaceae bacterium]MBT5664008.1 cytochrome c [Rhodospirillaceae bacterium]MBT5809746.1 cytochrome c [Rhodospirillaceae bacterium]